MTNHFFSKTKIKRKKEIFLTFTALKHFRLDNIQYHFFLINIKLTITYILVRQDFSDSIATAFAHTTQQNLTDSLLMLEGKIYKLHHDRITAAPCLVHYVDCLKPELFRSSTNWTCWQIAVLLDFAWVVSFCKTSFLDIVVKSLAFSFFPLQEQ